MIKHMLTIGWLLTFICIKANAQQIQYISPSQQASELSLSLEIYKDTSAKLTYPAVKNAPFQLYKQTTHTINPNAVYWGRLAVQSKYTADQQFVLYLGTANYCEAYIETVDSVYKEFTGRLVPLSQRKVKEGRNAPILLSLPQASQNQPITIYFRFQNVDNRPFGFNTTIYTEEAWQTLFMSRDLAQGIFNALMGTLVLYLLSLSILLKQRDYIYAAFYLFFIALYYLSSKGVLLEQLLQKHPKINELIWPNALVFSILSLILLTRSFLNTHQNLRFWHRALTVLFIIYAVVGCSTLVSLPIWFNVRLFDNTMLVLGIPTVVIILSTSILTLYKKIKKATLFAWSNIQLAVLFFLFILDVAFNYSSNNSSILLQLGYATQGIMFTIAFAQRMRIIEKEKRALQSQKMQLIAKQNELLEQKVEARSEELQTINHKILTQNEVIEKKNAALAQLQEEVEAQRDTIEYHNRTLNHRNTLITQSIRAAQNIQQAILPNQRKLDYLLKEHFIIYRPKDVVSGDFYWLNEIEGYTYLATVDCTGHGVPGALMSMIGNILLDKIIRVKKVTDPAQIIQQLHDEIYITLRQEETQNNYGMDMSLLIFKRFETHCNIRFCGARHSLHYYNPHTQEKGTFKGDRKSLGGLQNNDICFNTQEVDLSSGTFIYIGSDGMEDQNNSKRRRFSSQRVIQTLMEAATLPLNQQKETLEKTLENFMEGVVQRDDILIICFQV
ncbi:hypothetical protein BKI52_09885 [marine bacterium AO1-C]|nr:hypothetical protein BKI52_09885 [marine bacterium AO1-C]